MGSEGGGRREGEKKKCRETREKVEPSGTGWLSGSEGWFRSNGLEVMSLARSHCATSLAVQQPLTDYVPRLVHRVRVPRYRNTERKLARLVAPSDSLQQVCIPVTSWVTKPLQQSYRYPVMGTGR